MRHILLIVVTIILAVSCSGSSKNVDDTMSSLLSSAMTEVVDNTAPTKLMPMVHILGREKSKQIMAERP